MQCKRRDCTNEVEQIPGHRARQYCSDACRVAHFRENKADAQRIEMEAAKQERLAREHQEIRNDYPQISDESVKLLYDLKQRHGLHMMSIVGTALVRENGNGEAKMGQQRMQNLEFRLEQAMQGTEQLQERFRAYVRMTNAKISNLIGQLRGREGTPLSTCDQEARPFEYISEPTHIVLREYQMRESLTDEQLIWIRLAADRDISSYYGTDLKPEHLPQARQAYFRYVHTPDEAADPHIHYDVFWPKKKPEPESPGPCCSTVYDGPIIDRHTPNEEEPGQYDVLGNYWCADCQEAYQCMQNGAELGWPEINYFPYNPVGMRTLMIRAGKENWYKYMQLRGKKAHHTILEKTNGLLRDRERGIWPPADE